LGVPKQTLSRPKHIGFIPVKAGVLALLVSSVTVRYTELNGTVVVTVAFTIWFPTELGPDGLVIVTVGNEVPHCT